jgi:hypothetical protein
MKYMIILQDSKVVGTCFGHLKFWLHDGAMSVGWITSQGKMQEIHCGQLQIPVHCGQPFRRIADSVPVIADSF